MTNYTSVAVIGAGAYGTALADVAARAGREVVLHARTAATAELMQTTRDNPRLPGVTIDDAVFITADLALAARADIILLAVPSQQLRAALSTLAHCSPTAKRSSPAPRASSRVPTFS